ncbi:MAG TPA: hypothetical protein VFM27_19485, partial [Acidimicrobiales bacterium]|nr:hypothetical protein [Acidimicrobiales bacterium]
MNVRDASLYRRGSVAFAAACLGAVAAALVGVVPPRAGASGEAGAEGAAGAPSLSVDPPAGLVDGQHVAVTGTGFAAGSRV